MILLNINIGDIEKFCKISEFLENIFLKRNWDVFITLVLDGNKDQISRIIQNGLIKNICKNVSVWVIIRQSTIIFSGKLLMSGVKKLVFNSDLNGKKLDQIPKSRKVLLIKSKNYEMISLNLFDNYSRIILDLEDNIISGEEIQSRLSVFKSNIKVPVVFSYNEIYPSYLAVASQGVGILINFDFSMDVSLIDEILVNSLDFKKLDGLIPTIVQDEYGEILMLAYSSKNTLKRTIKTKEPTYYSRSRRKIWIKGEESGSRQILRRIYFDCDADSLIFIVKQKNVACHTGSYSCFNDSNFSIGFLYDFISDRIQNSSEKESYTKKLANNLKLLLSKIQEESDEVINYSDNDNLIWEISDLTYFLLVLMAEKGIFPNDVINELWRRNI